MLLTPLAIGLVLTLIIVQTFVVYIFCCAYSPKNSWHYMEMCAIAFLTLCCVMQPAFLFLAATITIVFDRPNYWQTHANAITDIQREEVYASLRAGNQLCVSEERPKGPGYLTEQRWRHNSWLICKLSIKRRTLRLAKKVQFSALLPICYVLATFFIVNVGSGSVFDRYLQKRYMESVVNIGESRISKFKPFTMEEFWEHIYNKVFSNLRDTISSESITSTLILLSTIRLRQTRSVKFDQDLCKKMYPTLIEPRCAWDVDSSPQETRHFSRSWNQPGRYGELSPYSFTEGRRTLSGVDFMSSKFYYPSGGYDFYLPIGLQDPEIFHYLQETDWLDQWTKLIRVDLTVYNADTSIATYIAIGYEFTSTAIFQESSRHSFYVNYSSRLKVMLLIANAVYFFIIIQTLLHELDVIKAFGIKSYAKDPFNYLTVVELTLSIVIVYSIFYHDRMVKQYLHQWREKVLDRTEKITHISFSSPADYDLLPVVGAGLIVLQLIKICNKARSFPMFNMFILIANNIKLNLLHAVFPFWVFALLGHMLFGKIEENFAKIYKSTLVLPSMLWDPVKYNAPFIEAGEYYKFYTYFVVMGLLLQFLFIKDFIVIIHHHFQEIKACYAAQKVDISIMSTLKAMTKAAAPPKEKKKVKTRTLKSSRKDKFIHRISFD